MRAQRSHVSVRRGRRATQLHGSGGGVPRDRRRPSVRTVGRSESTAQRVHNGELQLWWLEVITRPM